VPKTFTDDEAEYDTVGHALDQLNFLTHLGKNLTHSHSLFSLSLAFGIQNGTIRISLETVVQYHLITI